MATPIPENRARFSLRDVLAATGGTVRGPIGDGALALEGVSTDTRALAPGQAFVALRGEQFDGHDHLAAAAERGAVLAIVDRDVAAPPGLTLLRVGGTLDALGALAARHLAGWRALGERRLVAVTGSAGKTTTKRALAALLDALLPGEVHASSGNLNNLVGVPMTLLALEPRHRVAVLELGTSRRGEIPTLARMTRPDAGVVTLVAAAHSAGLGSIAEVEREKCALYEQLHDGAVAVGNVDDARIARRLLLAPVGQRVGYGASADAAVRVANRRLVALDRSAVELSRAGDTLSFEAPLVGRAGALACAAAVATVEALLHTRLDGAFVQAALAPLARAAGGRLEARRLPSGVVLLDDSYNSNPASAAASLEAARELADFAGGRLLLLLGEMRELGPGSAAAHLALGEQVARATPAWLAAVAGDARLTAERARELGVLARFVDGSAEAAELLLAEARPGDVVLVKGSRGVRTELCVQALEQRGGALAAGRVRHAGAAP